MNEEFINLTEENLEQEYLCCIIRTKTKHIGVERKRKWLKNRIKEGHIFRKLNQKATQSIGKGISEKYNKKYQIK